MMNEFRKLIRGSKPRRDASCAVLCLGRACNMVTQAAKAEFHASEKEAAGRKSRFQAAIVHVRTTSSLPFVPEQFLPKEQLQIPHC